MRFHVVAKYALSFVVVAGSAQLHAQFQAPTQDELKMTADPKAPGAAAVYLNVREVDNNTLHFESYYARIKVLSEKGKELATVQLPYLKGGEVTDIQARTIHSDGTIVPLVGKPADLLITKKGDFEFERKVFTLPSVEVGSILEYYFQFRDDRYIYSPRWEIQRPYFVHQAHYLFTPYREDFSFLWWTVLPQGMSVSKDASGRYALDMTDIPPAPSEEWMPPIDSILYKVVFYFGIGSTVDAYWGDAIKGWSKDVDHFAEPSKAVHQIVDGLIAPGDSDVDKAKKLYKAVQALDNTNFSRKKTESELKQLHEKEAKRAEDTWTQKSGTRDDIALLYLAMLRAAGLNAFAMKVVDRDQGIFAPGYFNFSQLHDTIIIATLGGKDVVLDPGEKMCPFLSTHWKHSLATGVRQGAAGGVATSPMQLYSENKLGRSGDITLDDHGAITGDLTFTLAGQDALRWRQAALEQDLSDVKKKFDVWIGESIPDGVEAHVDHFQGLDDPDAPLTAVVKVQGTLGTATAKRVMLPGFFFESRGHVPFVDQDKRQQAVDMHYGEQINDRLVYHLPAGLSVEGTPQDTKLPWTGHAMLVTRTTVAPGQITVVRSLARAFTFSKPDEYQDLRGFYQKVAAADQQQLVLTISQTAKGN
jgi:hypothetical protein